MHDPEIDELQRLLPNCLRQDRLPLEGKLARLPRSPNASEPLRRLLDEARRSIALRHRRHERLPQVDYPANLPIAAKKDEIVAAIRANPVIIIAGETGSGKTTQIPKMCLEAGCGVEGKIACTQPRRVAALSISRRIAEELHVTLGQEVGCKIRFSDRSDSGTYIKLMTDGILLAETQGDRDLNEYDAIVIDEAHERSLNIDFLLGHLKLLIARRQDLKVIITSATIDTEAFSRAFGDAPIIEVSGRTFPVEVRYLPHDAQAEESGELTYIDAAVQAVENVLLESERGDILVFMPSERDIRETQDDLHGRFSHEAEVVPLFGRLSAGEQDRVFAPSARRKIIIATNIAETSLTIPGVRYVVDTGLARLSRYSPRTRTKRLPIEPISQSSARQRAGRSGRVENGVCIRLYSEEDFAARPKDTQPEIQRANLAEVILKMKAWRLGEMETFPFINPPQPQAIQSGYQLLQELGALSEERDLTELGRELARLPVDPSIGRMILQSRQEGALSDVLIIAAGLSIQDPRERPMDKQEAADQAHRQFLDPSSDFLTLLKVWNAYDAQFEALRTQSQMRRFCRANFLSYNRMREWIDVHAQLIEQAERGGWRLEPGRPAPEQSPARGGPDRAARTDARTPERRPETSPNERSAGSASARQGGRSKPGDNASSREDEFERQQYAAIHRSILAGLLGHIAQRMDRNVYRASSNRQLMLWPGSSLFDRNAGQNKKPSSHQNPASSPKKVSQPAWIVAGEIVETSRLYGRTVASVSADWIAELGNHLCKRSYGEPFWDRRTARVLARERTTLFGLEVQDRAIDYGRVNPERATEMFIRAALVDEDIETMPRFLDQNRKLRQRVEVWRTQHRDHRLPNVEDALFEFYARHLQSVSSMHDLNRLSREHGAPDFLCAQESDLTGGLPLAWDKTAFPSEVAVADQRAPLEYAYAPGEEHDGITIKVPASFAHRIEARMLDLVVPGLREEQIEFLLRALPKSLRVPLMPLAPKVAELAAAIPSDSGLDGLRLLIQQKYGVAIPSQAWSRDALPSHLRPRIAIVGHQDKVLASGRDLQKLRDGLEKHETDLEQKAWARSVQQWERYALTSWSFGDLPEQIQVTDAAEMALVAFPGLEREDDSVHLKLFRHRAEAEAASRLGFARLVELALPKELAWVQKDLKSLDKLGEVARDFDPDLVVSAYENLRRDLIPLPAALLPLRENAFRQAVQQAKEAIPGLVPKFIELMSTLLRLRAEIKKHRGFPVPSAARVGVITDLRQLAGPVAPAVKGLIFLAEELQALLPPTLLRTASFQRLHHWPRYLKALIVRADRALLNPAKDAEKAKLLRPYQEALKKLGSTKDLARDAQTALEEYRYLLEEFKVSVFAQELGTAQPVSPKRLDAQLALIK